MKCGVPVLLTVDDLKSRAVCRLESGHQGHHSNGIFMWWTNESLGGPPC